MQKIRRSDREVTTFDEKMEIIAGGEVLRLGMIDGDFPYVVPLNYGYESDGETLILYVHGALEGKKIDAIKANSNVCFEMDSKHKFVMKDENSPCSATYKYESVIGFGKAEILADDDKIHGLKVLLKSLTGKDFTEFKPEMVARTTVIKITSADFTAKRSQ